MSDAPNPSGRRFFVAGQAGDPAYEDDQLRQRLSRFEQVCIIRPASRLAAERLIAAGQARHVGWGADDWAEVRFITAGFAGPSPALGGAA